MSAAEIAQVTRAHRADEIAASRVAHPALSARCAGACGSTCAAPCAGSLRTGGRHHRYPQVGADRQAGPDRGAARYIGLDERIYPAVPAFPARHHPTRRKRVSVFLFGTRLTNVTRALRVARSRRGAGTFVRRRCRTGPAAPGSRPLCIPSTSCGGRRVLGQGAIVLSDLRRAGARGRRQGWHSRWTGCTGRAAA